MLTMRNTFNQDDNQLKLKVRLYKDESNVERVENFAESLAMLKEQLDDNEPDKVKIQSLPSIEEANMQKMDSEYPEEDKQEEPKEVEAVEVEEEKKEEAPADSSSSSSKADSAKQDVTTEPPVEQQQE